MRRESEHQSGMRHIPQSIPLVLTKLWETQIFMQKAIFSAQQNIGKAIRRSTKTKKLSTPLSDNAFGCFCLKALRRPWQTGLMAFGLYVPDTLTA